VQPPIASANDRFAVLISSNFFASFALKASQPDVWILTRASVFGSGVALAGAAVVFEFVFEFEAAFSSFFGSAIFWVAGDAGGFLGSMIRFSPWKTGVHLSPLRT